MAQAAVEAAHLEEDAVLWAQRELAPGASLQLLGQTKPCSRHDEEQFILMLRLDIDDFIVQKNCRNVLTCRTGAAGRHVEAIVLMRGVGMRIWDVDTTERLLRPVRVSKMEAALKTGLIF